MSGSDRSYEEQNRRSWNRATRAHNRNKGDQAAFLREGGSTLFAEELALLGELDRSDLLHLQCNSGQDTLSLARLGARVTGIDISDEAISFARKLADACGLPAAFERADVYDWLPRAAEDPAMRFDRVFASYGAVCWLRDLGLWARGIASVLRPGGRMVLVEFHPAAMMFEEDWTVGYPYADGGRPHRVDDGVGDYVAQSGDGLAPSGLQREDAEGEPFRNDEACWEFFWSPLDVVGALVEAGLKLRTVREYPHVNGCRIWNDMQELPGRRYLPPAERVGVPMMYGIAAEK